MENVPSKVLEDHRVRVAREKRERMRAHLLKSVLVVCSGNPHREPAVIDQVIKHADVSRGTFYKYFDSLERAISELGLQLADEMTVGIYSVYDVLGEPTQRSATGFQMFLLRSIIEPDWGSFIADIGLLSGDNLFTHHIQTDIQHGIDSGAYAVASVGAAMDLLMGAKIEAIRRIVSGEHSSAYVRAMAVMVLRGLGVPPVKADRTVRKAYERICQEAPSKISWWRSVD